MRQADLTLMGFDEMGIEELLTLGREAGLLDLTELACHGTGAIVQVNVESQFDHGALTAIEYVDHWTHVAETGGSHLYVIAFTAPDLPESISETADDLVGTCEPELDSQGAKISLAGSQDDISDVGTTRFRKRFPPTRLPPTLTSTHRLLQNTSNGQSETFSGSYCRDKATAGLTDGISMIVRNDLVRENRSCP